MSTFTVYRCIIHLDAGTEYAVVIMESDLFSPFRPLVIRRLGRADAITLNIKEALFLIKANGKFKEEATFSTQIAAAQAAIDLCNRWTQAIADTGNLDDSIPLYNCRRRGNVLMLEQIAPYKTIERI